LRNWLTALAVLTGALSGYALAPGAARAQVGGPPFVPGQKLVLTFESGRNSQTCTVTLLREDFLGLVQPAFRRAYRAPRTVTAEPAQGRAGCVY
jgi:hypothetical protein